MNVSHSAFSMLDFFSWWLKHCLCNYWLFFSKLFTHIRQPFTKVAKHHCSFAQAYKSNLTLQTFIEKSINCKKTKNKNVTITSCPTKASWLTICCTPIIKPHIHRSDFNIPYYYIAVERGYKVYNRKEEKNRKEYNSKLKTAHRHGRVKFLQSDTVI